MTLAELMEKFERVELQRYSKGTWHISVERIGGRFKLDADVSTLEIAVEVIEALAKEGA